MASNLSGEKATGARFDAALCCTHVWILSAGESGEVCGTCGALCWRDENGRIEEYDNQPPQPVWDAAIWEGLC